MSAEESRRYLRPWWTNSDGTVRVFEMSGPLARLLGGAMVVRGSVVERVFVGAFAKTRAVRMARRYRATELAPHGPKRGAEHA